jgi:pantoate--beta-alanine ligase
MAAPRPLPFVTMDVIYDITELSPYTGGAFVPTMGALHAGHRSLIHQAVASGYPTLVSIFVNPAQFAPHEDLDDYPRTLERDLDMVRAIGVAAVFVPSAETIYPVDQLAPSMPLPVVATTPGLEDAHRPHFFGGVCGVVTRLFDLTKPVQSYFGEKDWQQLCVIDAMVRANPDRWPSLQVIGVPTVREQDGLAMSSRNVHLSADDRIRALALSRALTAARGLEPGSAETAMQEILHDSDLAVDYAVVRDAVTLTSPQEDRPNRALIAASLGTIRLIDNSDVG